MAGFPTPNGAMHRQAALIERLERLARLATVGPGDRRTFEVRAPFTGDVLAQLPIAGEEDAQVAVGTAREAFESWRHVPVRDRARPLLRFRDLVAERAESILDIVQIETGKARRHAFEELADVMLVLAYYSRSAPRLLRPRRRPGAVPGLTRTWEIAQPRGVVGVIVPWNYPLSLAFADSLPAVLAGNAVIVKPDVQTTHTALAGLELLREAGLPDGVFQVLPGDGPGTGTALVDRADYVSFTGSTRAGRQVGERAAARLIDCSLELGGKNPMIVRQDADLARAVSGAVQGCFTNAGQLCISIERLYVQSSVFDEFVSRFSERTRALRLGAGLDYEADVGSLTYEHQLRKVVEHVADAVGKGATVAAGGRARPDVGPLFYEPTVLTGVKPEMRVWSEETFGPVVAVQPYGSDEEAIELANATCFGLNASVWSRDTKTALRLAKRIEAGSVNVNDSYAAAWGSLDAPMGGWKESGSGRRHGAEGILKYTESQAVSIQRGPGLDLAAPWLASPSLRKAALTVLRRFRPRSTG